MNPTEQKRLRTLEDELGVSPHVRTVCGGHLGAFIYRCNLCKDDEKNKDCEYYKPRTIWSYEVKKVG